MVSIIDLIQVQRLIHTVRTMKKNSVIINTARGGIVNEIDLNQALNEKIIFAAVH